MLGKRGNSGPSVTPEPEAFVRRELDRCVPVPLVKI